MKKRAEDEDYSGQEEARGVGGVGVSGEGGGRRANGQASLGETRGVMTAWWGVRGSLWRCR